MFYGENEAEYGNPTDENESAQRKAVIMRLLTLTSALYFGGVPYEDLPGHGINLGAIDPYLPAPVDELISAQVDVRYLGYYLPWTPQENFYSVEHCGFKANTERTEGLTQNTIVSTIKLMFITIGLR